MVAKRRLLALAALLAAAACGLAAFNADSATGREPVAAADAAFTGDSARPAVRQALLVAVGSTFALASLLLLASARTRGRTTAWLRLDHFLPRLRRPKPGLPVRTPSLAWRTARRLLPASWLSDPATARPGLLRRTLKRIGLSAQSAPLRRIVQGAAFLLFLYLFHYVCWPYTARPAPPVRSWPGASCESIDQATGAIRFVGLPDSPPSEMAGRAVELSEASSDGGTLQPLGGRFTATTVAPGAWVVQPLEPLADDQLDRLLTGGPWTLSDGPLDAWPSHYADDLAHKERIAAELFLVIDPLVSLSTAIAGRSWVWSLASAAAILFVCVVIPRGFCGYLCPLGTLIDLFDTLVGRRVTRFQAPDDGWWVHVKYYLLAGVMTAAAGGVLLSGYCAAIPVVTRGFLFVVEPLQTGALRGGHLIPPFNAGHFVSLALLAGVLGLGFFKPRFWCKYVCPSGAVFSVFNLARVTERKVESSCIHCNKCVEVCPFDAIKPDFTTRTTDCTLCQTCGGVCPTESIKFVDRWNLVDLKLTNDPPTGETAWGRRGFLSIAAGSAAALAGGATGALITRAFGAGLDDPSRPRPVRPPGSVPEESFLQLCIRCGECFKACPNNVLHPLGFEQGLEGLWTPQVKADWAGCESSCNACGQVCPTGAIRALPLEEKRVARMGLAVVDRSTCLPYAGREACQLCVDDCHAAGYHAIEFTRVHTQADADGSPLEDSGFLAPVVLADKCVGCGLCQTRCYGINAADKGLLDVSAIIVLAGEGREDRLAVGSYRALRDEEARRRQERGRPAQGGDYLPDFLQPGEPQP